MVRPRTFIITGTCLAAAWVLWSCCQPLVGTTEEQLAWLLRQDARLLAAENNSSAWEMPILGARRFQLNRAYKNFLRQNPHHEGAMVAYGCFLYDQRQERAAIKWWEQSIKENPNLAAGYCNLAEQLVDTGEIKRALPLLDLAIKLAPAEPHYHFLWATIVSAYRNEARDVYGWNTTEIMRRSLTTYRRARDLAPANITYSVAYAEMFGCVADPDFVEAYNAWKFCAEQPQSECEQQRACGRVARMCLYLKRYDEAQQWISKMEQPELVSMRAALDRKRTALMNGATDDLGVVMRAKSDEPR